MNKKGQSLIEYVLIITLVSIVCIGTLTTLGKKIDKTFDKINRELTKLN